MANKYESAIARLRKIYEQSGEAAFNDAIEAAWARCNGNENGCLFLFCSPSGNYERVVLEGLHCGCLTQVRAPEVRFPAWTPELTEKIRADDRIPFGPNYIRHPDQLEVFREYQELMDNTIRKEA